MVTTGSEDFVLEGANPSAEGEDAEEGGESTQEKVLDIVQQFRLNKVDGMDKKAYTSELKSQSTSPHPTDLLANETQNT